MEKRVQTAVSSKAPGFAGPSQPYRLRGGDFGVVMSRVDEGYAGFLLSSGSSAGWDDMGRDSDGDANLDLMELVRPGSTESNRLKDAVTRIQKAHQNAADSVLRSL